MSTLRPKLKNKNNSNLLNIFETIGIVIFFSLYKSNKE